MNKSRDQDLFYYFSGLHENTATRHFLIDNFRKDYDTVRSAIMQPCRTMLIAPL